MDSDSKNTGANVKNVEAEFVKYGLAPKRIMIITASVFQRRAVATWLQQYGLPMDVVYSIPAVPGDLKMLRDAELVELADEAALQVRRLTEYAAPDKKFTIPVRIPAEVAAAEAELTEYLIKANQLNFAAGHDHAPPKLRSPLRSYTTLLFTVVAIVGLFATLAYAPTVNIFKVMFEAIPMFGVVVLGGVMIAAINGIVFSPHGVPLTDSMKPGARRSLVSTLQNVLPVTIGLAIALVPILGFVQIPLFLNITGLIIAGLLVRSWGGVEARNRNKPGGTPGAAGFWAKTNVSLRTAGALEGLFVVILSGGLFILPALFGGAHLPSGAMWAALTAAGLAVSALFLNAIHRWSGVTLTPGGEPVRDAETISRAVRTSYLSLLGIPVLAAAFVLPGFAAAAAFAVGVVLAIVPHAVVNGHIEKSLLTDEDRADAARTAKILAALNAARAGHDAAAEAAALASLVSLENIGLDQFGQDPKAGQDIGPWLAIRFAARSAARRQNSASAQTLSAALTASTGVAASSDVRRKDSVAILARGTAVDEIAGQVREASAVATDLAMIVILTKEQESLAAELRAQFGESVRFVLESELQDPASVLKNLLNPVRAQGGKLKMILQQDGGIPEFIINNLAKLSQNDQDLVAFVLVATLSSSAFAVTATLGDLQKGLEYSALVMTQA